MPEYWKPSVAADLVIFSANLSRKVQVLLIERKHPPFKDRLAFPGGFLDPDDEDLVRCAQRELQEETGLRCQRLNLLTVRSAKDRDPRQNRVISVSYVGYLDGCPKPIAGDDATTARWVPLSDLKEGMLAFDHWDILKEAAARMVTDVSAGGVESEIVAESIRIRNAVEVLLTR